MAPLLFRIFLIAVALYAFWRGGRDERVVATTCVLGALLTHLSISPVAQRYDQIELGTFLVDVAVLAGFTVVALRSNRFWPLWAAGLQLTTLLGHIMKGVNQELLPQAYGAALQFWSYPILLILLVGTYRAHQRSRQEQGKLAEAG
jgi:uncharacterized membrane protein